MTLAEYYRTHGESEHVAVVEAALTEEWQATMDVVSASGKSAGYCNRVLAYLAEEGRAERSKVQAVRPMFGHDYKHLWRRPSRGVSASVVSRVQHVLLV